MIYFIGLMCTHISAFRVAENIRKEGVRRLLGAPLGFFDTNASGFLRNRLDNAAAETETLLAHIIADITGTFVMFVGMVVLMLYFDWRMGIACLLTAVVSIAAMTFIMGGKNKKTISDYQEAQDFMSKAGTEYIRGIPVVKMFQQTIHSFKAFKESIENYSAKAKHYNNNVCKIPQTTNLTFTEGAFVFLVPLITFLAPYAFMSGNAAIFITDYAFYAIFSAIISTALARLMFASSGIFLADIALQRVNTVLEAPSLPIPNKPKSPGTNDVEFRNVTFFYEGSSSPALRDVSFKSLSGQTIALVGPSGSGKTTIANLIPRFWDVDRGSIQVGGIDVREISPMDLMDKISFVFQNSRLFKKSIMENVRISKPSATDAEVIDALKKAQCEDILEKLPIGADTIIGTKGVYLSGGEQQRILLARAILKDSPIIVLDEATAFVDPENENLIQKALDNLTKDRTVIMIAHRLSTIVNVDRILVVNNGRIVEEGPHKKLIEKNGLYAKMWKDYNRSIEWKISSGKEVS